MSEADGARAGRDEVWIEKYRPRTLDEIVGQESITDRLQSYVERNDLPHMLFSGRAGIGKCTTGETPVLTGTGLRRMDSIVGEGDGFGEPAADLSVVTLTDSGEFEYTKPSHTYTKTAERTVEVTTTDGASLTVTPEHRLLTQTPSGPSWHKAADLSAGDRIYRPRSAPLPPVDTRLNWMGRMVGDDTLVQVDRTLACRLDLTDGCVTSSPSTDMVTCSLATLRSVDLPTHRLRDHIGGVGLRSAQNSTISPQWHLTPELAGFLGRVIAVGTIEADRLILPDDSVGATAVSTARSLFDVTPTADSSSAEIHFVEPTLIRFLEACFDVLDSDGEVIASTVLSADKPARRAFIDAIRGATGSETTDQDVLTLPDEQSTTLLSYLCTAEGIRTRRIDQDSDCPPHLALEPDSTGAVTEEGTVSIAGTVGAGGIPAGTALRGAPGAGALATRTAGSIPASGANRLAADSVLLDTVESTRMQEGQRRVYDLTVPASHNYIAGSIPTVMHNTTAAQAVARELYGEDWAENFLELNASDERGIDVVRDRIKSFARTSFGGHDYRIIFLDEADALTSDAQSALRRTMEQFSNNVRFILSCNYSSQIIDPIQSRCAVFRFSPLPDEAIETQLRRIADAEDIELEADGIEALIYAADGDMRKAINGLQAAAVTGGVVDESAVYEVTSTARPEEIREMVELALEGDFTAARSRLDRLVTEEGIAGGDILDQLHRTVWEFDLDDERAVRLLDRIGETEYRITQGATERIQLEALLASLALEDVD